MRDEAGLTKSVIIVFFTSLFHWLLGCARIIIVAFLFGATFAYDAYLVAFTIPEMITGLLVGVITVTFIPIFTDYLVKEDKIKAWDFASSLINIFFIIGLLLTLVMIAIAPFIIRIAAPGFGRDTFRLTLRLIVIITPIVLIIPLAELLTRILHTYQKFAFPNLIRILEIAVVIICLIFLSRKIGIFALACGILLGALVRLFFQLPPLWSELKYYRFNFNFRLPGIKKVSLVAAPLLSCMLFFRIGILIERLLASTLKEGSISVLGYASALTQVPPELFMGSLCMVLFPLTSKYASEGKINEFRTVVSKGIRIGNFVLIPTAVLFIFFGKLIIRSLLERGQFTSAATQDTSIALAIYALSLFAMAVYFLSTHACYALQEIKAAVNIAIFATALNIVLKLILINFLAFIGLALATSIALIVHSGLLIGFVKKKIGSIDESTIGISTLKILAASLLMVGACWASMKLVPADAHNLVQLAILIVSAGISYPAFSYLLQSQELFTIKDLLKRMIIPKV